MLAEKNEYIGQAYHHLQIISQNDAKRLEYEAREKAIRDHLQYMQEATEKGIDIGMKQGRREGIKEGRREGQDDLIRTMLKTMSVLQIANATDIPVSRIQKIADDIYK